MIKSIKKGKWQEGQRCKEGKTNCRNRISDIVIKLELAFC